jgi:cell division septation protein DedD
MGEAEDKDTEITLGTDKLLGMFFALAVICAIFFGLGYSLGRSGAKQAAPISDAVQPPPPVSAAAKPSASKPAATTPADAGSAGTDELTFYKSVEQNDANPQLPAAAAPSAPPANNAAVELTKPAPGAYVVQVAAVSKQEDADILFNALKKKQYPVFVTTADTDKLFHVQVGPFADPKEAENMKARLTSDGYSPILKK